METEGESRWSLGSEGVGKWVELGLRRSREVGGTWELREECVGGAWKLREKVGGAWDLRDEEVVGLVPCNLCCGVLTRSVG